MTETLLIEVLVALGAGNLSLGPIHSCDGGERIEGAMLTSKRQRGHVRVNLASSATDTALHELVHRLRPKWPETKVRRETAQMMRGLSDAQLDKIYEMILAVGVVKKRPIFVE